MIAMFSFVQGWLSQFHDDERGQWYAGPGGILVTILVVLAIICLGFWLYFNVGVNEK